MSCVPWETLPERTGKIWICFTEEKEHAKEENN